MRQQHPTSKEFVPGSGGAKYRCLRCGREFVGDAGPATWHWDKLLLEMVAEPNQCPVADCKSEYVEWLNYEDFKI